MSKSSPFKWRQFEGEIILMCVRWYLRYALSYRDLKEIMGERGLAIDHTTIFRWVQRYTPELEKRCRPCLKPTNDSYRVDETYIKVKRKWKYLYRAVDSEGNTLDFLLCAGVAPQTSMMGSWPRRSKSRVREDSATSRGTMAELSQNFTGFPNVPPGAPGAHYAWISAREPAAAQWA